MRVLSINLLMINRDKQPIIDESEAFGDFAARVGQPALAAFAADYVCTSAVAK